MTDSLYKGTGGHNYIQDEDMETSFIKQQQAEVYKIFDATPVSLRIDALESYAHTHGWSGFEGRTIQDELDTLTAQIIKNTFTEALRIIDEHDPNKSMARKTSSAYWGNTLRKEIEDIINKLTQHNNHDK